MVALATLGVALGRGFQTVAIAALLSLLAVLLGDRVASFLSEFEAIRLGKSGFELLRRIETPGLEGVLKESDLPADLKDRLLNPKTLTTIASTLDGSLHPVRRGRATVSGSVFVKFEPPLLYTPRVRKTSEVWHGSAWTSHDVEITNVSPLGFDAAIVEKRTAQIDPTGWATCELGWIAEP